MEIPDWSYCIPWDSSRGELVLKVHHVLTEPTCPTVILMWENSKEVVCRFDKDTIEEGVKCAISWACENIEFKVEGERCH